MDVPPLSDTDLERIEDLAGIQAVAAGVREAMEHLPADQRRAVELRIIEESGYEEIARSLKVTQQVARARVSRGLRALAASLNARGVFAEDLAQRLLPAVSRDVEVRYLDGRSLVFGRARRT